MFFISKTKRSTTKLSKPSFSSKASLMKLTPDHSLKKMRTIIKFHKIVSYLTGKKFIPDSAESRYYNREYYKKFLMFELLIAILAGVSILNGIIYYELTYNLIESYSKTDVGSINLVESQELFYVFEPLLYSCSIFTLLIILAQGCYDHIYLNFKKEVGIIGENETFFTSGMYKPLLYQLILFIPHPSPIYFGLIYISTDENKTENQNSLNSLFTILLFPRIIYLIRFCLISNKFMTPETNTICKSLYFDTDFIFASKAYFKTLPTKVFLFLGIYLIYCFSFSIRIFERGIDPQKFENFFNPIWFVVATMTTVGYGDIAPLTIEGKFLTTVACILGVFIVSMMITSITEFFSMSVNDINAYLILEKVEINKNLKDSASKVIYNWLSVFAKYKSFKASCVLTSKEYQVLRTSIIDFKKKELVMDSLATETYQLSTINNNIQHFGDEYNKYVSRKIELTKSNEKIMTDVEELMHFLTENKYL